MDGHIGECCSKKYPAIFANLDDREIWSFIEENGVKNFVNSTKLIANDSILEPNSTNTHTLDAPVGIFMKPGTIVGIIGSALVIILFLLVTIVFICVWR